MHFIKIKKFIWLRKVKYNLNYKNFNYEKNDSKIKSSFPFHE